MFSYETLDAIADSYNPVLALASLAFIAASVFRAQWRLVVLRLSAFIVIVFVAYGLMFLDRRLNIWPAFGLDYSTHTAVALGLVLFLSFSIPRWAALWVCSFISYVLLMLYQRYHTITDITTTGLAVGVPMTLTLAFLHQPRRVKTAVQALFRTAKSDHPPQS